MPNDNRETLTSPKSEKWQSAMKDELNIMYKRQVWTLVLLPKNKKILGNKWVYTVKKDENNKIVRYKARLVAQGFKQKKGETYDDVFNAVVNFSIIRIFFFPQFLFICTSGYIIDWV